MTIFNSYVSLPEGRKYGKMLVNIGQHWSNGQNIKFESTLFSDKPHGAGKTSQTLTLCALLVKIHEENSAASFWVGSAWTAAHSPLLSLFVLEAGAWMPLKQVSPSLGE